MNILEEEIYMEGGGGLIGSSAMQEISRNQGKYVSPSLFQGKLGRVFKLPLQQYSSDISLEM